MIIEALYVTEISNVPHSGYFVAINDGGKSSHIPEGPVTSTVNPVLSQ